MLWRYLCAGLLVGLAEAFNAAAPIRWGGLSSKRFVIAVMPGESPLAARIAPQKLTIGNPSVTGSANVIPYFRAKPDGTIAWEARGWCLEASGAEAQVTHCSGEPTQKWNWLPWGPIQLEGTNQCLYASDGAPLELRECENKVAEQWRFEYDPIPVRTQKPWQSQTRSIVIPQATSSLLFLLSMPLIGALSLGAWLWQRRQNPCSVAASQGIEFQDDIIFDDGAIQCFRTGEIMMQMGMPTVSPQGFLQFSDGGGGGGGGGNDDGGRGGGGGGGGGENNFKPAVRLLTPAQSSAILNKWLNHTSACVMLNSLGGESSATRQLGKALETLRELTSFTPNTTIANGAQLLIAMTYNEEDGPMRVMAVAGARCQASHGGPPRIQVSHLALRPSEVTSQDSVVAWIMMEALKMFGTRTGLKVDILDIGQFLPSNDDV